MTHEGRLLKELTYALFRSNIDWVKESEACGDPKCEGDCRFIQTIRRIVREVNGGMLPPAEQYHGPEHTDTDMGLWHDMMVARWRTHGKCAWCGNHIEFDSTHRVCRDALEEERRLWATACMCDTVEDGWRPCPPNLCERSDHSHATSACKPTQSDAERP